MSIIALLSSCVPVANRDLELPQGVWKSVEPNIILYIDPEYLSPVRPNHYLGIYTAENEKIKIFISFDTRSLALRLMRVDSLDSERRTIDFDRGILFVGWFEVIDGKFHYFLTERFREETGYEVIVFQRWEDYDPIDPADWFPSQE